MHPHTMAKLKLSMFALWIATIIWMTGAQLTHAAVDGHPSRTTVSRTFSVYTGISATAPTSIVVDQEGHPRTTIDNVRFVSKPFVSPPYYGLRYQWDWPARTNRLDRVGLDVEFIHFKIYYESGEDPHGIIQRFTVTDGLNLVYLNAVGSKEIREDLYLTGRIGVGPVIAHPETEIRHQAKGYDGDWSGFEYAGLTWQAGLALEKALDWPLSMFRGSRVLLEYKYTVANPTISIAGGSATTSVNTHHLVAGWSIRL